MHALASVTLASLGRRCCAAVICMAAAALCCSAGGGMYALVLAGARGSPLLRRCDLHYGRRSAWCSPGVGMYARRAAAICVVTN